MNQAQKKALNLYRKNKRLVNKNPDLPILRLCLIAKQQDKYYLVIHDRRDKRR